MTPPIIVHIVDDDEPVRTSLSETLEVYGFQTVIYATGSAFLNRIERGEGVLISDVRMTGMSGIELTRCLRLGGSTMPVILVTGHADKALLAEASNVGADAIFEKPLALATLLAELDRLTKI